MPLFQLLPIISFGAPPLLKLNVVHVAMVSNATRTHIHENTGGTDLATCKKVCRVSIP